MINVDLVLPLSIAAGLMAASALAAHWLSTEGSGWDQPAGRIDSSRSSAVGATAPGS